MMQTPISMADAVTIQRITTPHAPIPAGHYSQATVHQGVVYVAGQLSIDPVTGAKLLGSAGEQTERTLRNVEAILLAAGSDLAHVLKMTVYVRDISLWGEVNEAYARVMGEHKPARAIVPTRDLHHGCVVEIDAIAAVKVS
jgi:2-iminobutanoate/2-iminopropanoate deaminase